MIRAQLKPHRLWLSLFAGALLLLFAGLPLAEHGLSVEQRRAAEIAAQKAELQESMRRFQDDLRLAHMPNAPLNAEAMERLLAPADRRKIVAELERQATASRLSHFTYALAPEKKIKATGVDALDLAENDVSLSADVPLDTDAYAFLQTLGSILPGRVRIQQLTLTRIASDAPRARDNLHMEAVLEWLSNSMVFQKAGAP